MKRLLTLLLALSLITMMSACSNLKVASKSSTSLSSFLGLSELPDWYVQSKYRYPDSKWIDNDFGLPIHYRDVGEGPVIVLIHGELSSLHVWEQWIDGLQEDYRVIALDLPGAGLTGIPACVDDPEEGCAENLNHDYLSHTLKYFIEDLKLSKFTLVGNSYGGYLATQYALQNSDKVSKLILISPSGFQQELPESLDFMTSSGTDIFSYFVQPSALVADAVSSFYGENKKVPTDIYRRYIHLAQSDGAHKGNVKQLKLVRKVMEEGTTYKISDIPVPTLILWGENDQWGNPEHGRLWDEEVSDSILVKYPNFGHAPMEEQPEETLADLIAFMQGDDIPSLIGLGTSVFTIEDAEKAFDKDALFGNSPMSSEPAEPSEQATEMEDTQ